MSATISISQDDIFKALRAFLLGLVSCEVVQGLNNGVAMPVDPFIAMTPLYFDRIGTNRHVYSDVGGTEGIEQHISYCIQIDCYGPNSSDWASIITTTFRDEYGCNALAPLVSPLHADDPKQIQIVDGEENYEQRWMITAYMQYNPVVVIPMQFFDAVRVTLIDVDATLFNNLDSGFILDSQSQLG